LKSPVIRNSCGVVAASERKVYRSVRKSEKGTGLRVFVVAGDIEDSYVIKVVIR